jgi:hypothetical protein
MQRGARAQSIFCMTVSLHISASLALQQCDKALEFLDPRTRRDQERDWEMIPNRSEVSGDKYDSAW